MASLVGSLLFPLKLGNESSGSTPLCASGAKTTFNLCNSGRRIVCSCVALPQNFRPADEFSASKHNDLSHLENLSMVREHVDDSDVLIECREVYKSFGEKHILKGVNFKVRHGEAVGIIGPSGTGKSTILKIIAGLLAPDKGEVLIRGKKRHGLISDEEISGLRIGLVFQSAALFDSLTVRENVGFLLYENSSMPENKIEKLFTETLAAVGLKVVCRCIDCGGECCSVGSVNASNAFGGGTGDTCTVIFVAIDMDYARGSSWNYWTFWNCKIYNLKDYCWTSCSR